LLILFIAFYLLVTILISFFASRLIHNSNDFILAGRQLPLILNSFALFALWFGSETIFGASSEFSQHGFLGVIEDPFGGALCLLLYGIFFAKPIYKMNLVTLGDLFRNVYGPRVELISGVFMLLTFLGYIAAQLVALGILFNVTAGISFSTGILISAVIVGFYTLIGGMWAISLTDFLQSIVIIAGLIWVSIKLGVLGGGFEKIMASTPDHFFRIIPDGKKIGWLEYFAAWTVIGLGSLPSQDIFQRVNSAKSVRNAVLSSYLGAGLYLLFAMLPLFIGLAAKNMIPATDLIDQQFILPEIIKQHTVMPVQIMFFGALISAIFSTASGAILAPASILSENIIKPLYHGKLTERRFLQVLRFSVLIMTVLATLMAFQRNNIYDLVAQSSILGMVSLLVPMVFAIYLPKYATSTGALASMVIGLGSWIIFEYVIEIDFPTMLMALFVSLVSMLGGKLINHKL